MRTVLIANMGARDIKWSASDELISQSDLAGLEDDPNLYGKIELPILSPLLEEFLKSTGRSPEVWLCSTRQGESVPPEYRQKDTYAGARVARRVLTDTGQKNYCKLVSSVKVLEPITDAPHSYDHMLRWYSDNLSEPLASLSSPEDQVHVSLTGGTPAMNTALLLSSYDLAGVEGVWHVDQATSSAKRIGIGRALAGRRLMASINTLLDRYDFRGVSDIARPVASELLTEIMALAALIQAGNFRESLGHVDTVEQLLEDSQTHFHFVDRLSGVLHWTRLLAQGQEAMQAGEIDLCDGMRAIHRYLLDKIKRGFESGDNQYAVALVLRLNESLRRVAVGRLLRRKIGGHARPSTRRKEMLEGLEDAHSRGVYSRRDYKKLKSMGKKGGMHPKTMAQHLIEHSGEYDCLCKWNRDLTQSGRGKSIVQLRNESTFAHGFSMISDADIRHAGWKGGPAELYELSEKAAREVLGPLGPSGMDQLQELLLQSLAARILRQD